MRFIRTTNAFVEFIEADNSGKILSSRGFQMGTVYFQIKNGKVTFYMNDNENPYKNDIWTTNIPLIIDDVEYATEDEVSNALHHIMNDTFQEQLDQLKEDLAAENARAEEAEEQLDDKIDDEQARAIAQENRLQDEITELSGTVATFDGRIIRIENETSALTVTVNNEITRSSAKDLEHDAEISGLTNTLNSEMQRALSAETQLRNAIDAEITRASEAESGITANLNAEIQNRIADVDAEENRALIAESGITSNLNAEIQNRIADVDAEEARALLAESGLSDTINAEIARSVAKDAEIDAEISGLTSDIATETTNRIAADNLLQDNLDNEIERAEGAESGLTNAIQIEANRAQNAEAIINQTLTNEIARSTAKDSEHDTLISGLTEDIEDEIARAIASEADIQSDVDAEVARATSAETALSDRISAEVTRASGVENGLRTDLTAEVVRATSAETAEYNRATAIEGGLRSDLNAEVARATAAELTKANKATSVASAEYIAQNMMINFKNADGAVISSIDARAFVKDGMVSDAYVSNGNIVIVFNTDAGKQNITIPITEIFDSSQYYKKSEIDATQGAQDLKINTLSGNVAVLDAKVDGLSGETEALEQLINAKQNRLSTGRGIDITNDVISCTLQIPDSYTKVESDAKYATIDNFNAHSGDSVLHITAQERSTWNAKQDHMQAGSGISISNNTINCTVSGSNVNIQELTQQEYDDLQSYDPDALYIISDATDIDLSAYATTSITDALDAEIDTHTADTSIHVTTAEKNAWNAKSDFDGNYNNLTNKPTIPSKTSQLTNDSNFATTAQVSTATADMATKTWVGNQGFAYNNSLAAHTASTSVHVTTSEKNAWNAKSDFSGSYNDLTNKPSIPDSTSDLTNDSGFITITDVQSELNGYATQNYVNTYVSGYTYDKSTIDEKIAQGGTFDPTLYYQKSETSGKTEISNALALKANSSDVYLKTETSGKTEISTALSNKQDTLISSQNIKTINGESVLGSGNISISSTGGISSAECQTMINNSISGKADTSSLATVATSGNYNDLSNKPTIPSYTAGSGVTISNNVISAKIWSGTQAQFDAITTKDNDCIYLVY